MADQQLDGLIVPIKADLANYVKGMDQMQSQTEKAAGKVSSSLETISNKLSVVGVGFTAFAATAIKSAMAWGEAVDDLSDKTGLAGEESSKLLLVAKRVGIGAEEAAGMFTKFARSANTAAQAQADAAVQGKTSTDVYTKLGIALTNSDGTLKSTATLFDEVKTKISALPDGLQRTATEMEVFGRSGSAMHDMLNLTASEMQAVIDKGKALGLVLTTEQANSWEQFGRNVNSAKGTLTAIGIAIGIEVLPQLQKLLENVSAVTKAYTNMDAAQKSVASSIMKVAGEIVVATVVVRALGAAVGVAVGPWGLLAGVIYAATGTLADWNKESQKSQELAKGGKYVTVGNHTEFQKTKTSPADYGDYLKREMEGGSFTAPEKKDTAEQAPLGYVGSAGESKKAKTELEEYLANLTEYKDIWTRQIELGQISQTQFKELLVSQLAGLESISVGQDEQLTKERGIYDLKSLIRQAEKAKIAEQQAQNELDFAKNKENEKQYHDKKMANLDAEIALTAEGSEKNLTLQKSKIEEENRYAALVKQNLLTQIGYQQQLSLSTISLEQEQLRHSQQMQAIGAVSTTTDQLERNAADEKRILNETYLVNVAAVSKKIALQKTGSEEEQRELKSLLNEKLQLESTYNEKDLALSNKLEEQKQQLQKQTATEYSQMIADMITGTRSGQDILQSLWSDFVQKVIQKLLQINKVTNIVDSVISGLFGSSATSVSSLSLGDVFRASGGSVNSNESYIVGEQGPELFVPTSSGTIVSNGALSSSQSGSQSSAPTVNIINNTGTEATPTVSQSFDMGKQVINIVLDAANRNVGGMRDMMKGFAKA